MKWQQREYSPQQMQQMQQEALERVRQLQQRSRQVLKRPSRPPSFFVEPQSDPPAPVQPAPSAEPHPTGSYHPQPQTPPLSSADANGASLLDFLPLERDQLLILGLLWLLYSDHCTDNTRSNPSYCCIARWQLRAKPDARLPGRSSGTFCLTTIPL